MTPHVEHHAPDNRKSRRSDRGSSRRSRRRDAPRPPRPPPPPPPPSPPLLLLIGVEPASRRLRASSRVRSYVVGRHARQLLAQIDVEPVGALRQDSPATSCAARSPPECRDRRRAPDCTNAVSSSISLAKLRTVRPLSALVSTGRIARLLGGVAVHQYSRPRRYR
jgi:hypothetical protein